MNGRRKRSGERVRDDPQSQEEDGQQPVVDAAPARTHAINVGLGSPLIIEDLD